MDKIQKAQYLIKTCLDKFITLVVLLLLSPLLLIIALLIKIDSRGPVIFKQNRIGRYGKVFTIYKFRTMCDNAINMGDGIFVTNNDYRITRIGKILRKTSLDELPQLINIIKSEMSFVGPRPPLEDHPYRYTEYDEFQKLRFQILPGITGYAQAYGRNAIKWPERIVMDVFYYKNFSLLFDIKIILTTILTVLSSKGTYSNRNNVEKLKF